MGKKPIKAYRGASYPIEKYPLDPIVPRVSSGYYPGVYFYIEYEGDDPAAIQQTALRHGGDLYEVDLLHMVTHDTLSHPTSQNLLGLPPLMFNSFESYWNTAHGGIDSIVAKDNARIQFFAQLLSAHAYLSLSAQDFQSKFNAQEVSVDTSFSVWTRLFWNSVLQGQYQSFFGKLEQLLHIGHVEKIHTFIRNDYLMLAKKYFPEMEHAFIVENNTVIRRHGFPELLDRNARVMVGDHGIYIELHDSEDIRKKMSFVSAKSQYDEYRDPDNIKYYFQTAPVNYASYLPGKWYVDIYDYFKKEKPRELQNLQKQKSDPVLTKTLIEAYYAILASPPSVLDVTLHDEKTIIENGEHAYKGKKTSLLKSIYPVATTQQLIERFGDSFGIMEVLPDPGTAIFNYALSNGYEAVKYATYDEMTKRSSLKTHILKDRKIDFSVVASYYEEHKRKPEKHLYTPHVYRMDSPDLLRQQAHNAGFECSSASGYGEVRFLMSMGYDGMIRGNELIAFNPLAFTITKEYFMEKKTETMAPSLFDVAETVEVSVKTTPSKENVSESTHRSHINDNDANNERFEKIYTIFSNRTPGVKKLFHLFATDLGKDESYNPLNGVSEILFSMGLRPGSDYNPDGHNNALGWHISFSPIPLVVEEAARKSGLLVYKASSPELIGSVLDPQHDYVCLPGATPAHYPETFVFKNSYHYYDLKKLFDRVKSEPLDVFLKNSGDDLSNTPLYRLALENIAATRDDVAVALAYTNSGFKTNSPCLIDYSNKDLAQLLGEAYYKTSIFSQCDFSPENIYTAFYSFVTKYKLFDTGKNLFGNVDIPIQEKNKLALEKFHDFGVELLRSLPLPLIEFNSKDFYLQSSGADGFILTTTPSENAKAYSCARDICDLRSLPEEATPMTYMKLISEEAGKNFSDIHFKDNNVTSITDFLRSHRHITSLILSDAVDAIALRVNDRDMLFTTKKGVVGILTPLKETRPVTKDMVVKAGLIPKDFTSYTFTPIVLADELELKHTKGVFRVAGKVHAMYNDFPVVYKSLEVVGKEPALTNEYAILQKLNNVIDGMVPKIGNVVDTKHGILFQLEALEPLHTTADGGKNSSNDYISLDLCKLLLQVARDIDKAGIWVGEAPQLGRDNKGNVKFFDFSLASFKTPEQEKDLLNYSSEKTIAQTLIDLYLSPDDARSLSHERALEHAQEVYAIRAQRGSDPGTPEIITNGYLYRMTQRPFDVGTFPDQGFVGVHSHGEKDKDGYYAILEYSEPLTYNQVKNFGFEFDSMSPNKYATPFPASPGNKNIQESEKDMQI